MREFEASLWRATATAAPATAALADDIRVDVAIIGGGLTGLSAALHLAKAGVRTALLEAHELGSGATGRNGGFVVPSFAKSDPQSVIEQHGELGERLVDLVGTSASALFELVRTHHIPCDAAQHGWYQAAHSRAALARIEQRARQWEARGQPVALHDAATTTELTGVRGYLGSWSNATGGTVHPLKLAHGLAAVALAHGATIYTASPVRAMRRTEGIWRLTAGRGEVRTERVLVCTNALSQGLLPVLARAVIPAQIYQVASEPVPPAQRASLLGQGQGFSDTRINLFTYRFDAEWRLITGALPGPYASRRGIGARMAARLKASLALPELPRMQYIWSGEASVSPDFLPALYELDAGVLAGTACNGRGVALSVELGRVLAEAVRAGSTRAVPLPLRSLQSVRSRHAARWGIRWYPLYGTIRDRLEQLAS